MPERPNPAAPRLIALLAAAALVVVLLLHWQSAFGVGRSGWSGAGWFAGAAALVVVAWELTRRIGLVVDERGPDLFGAAAALATAVAVLVKFLGDAHERATAAWIGLALAAVLTLAAVAIALRPGPAGGRRDGGSDADPRPRRGDRPGRRKAPPLRTRR